jgi:uncharacterized protein involved in cysteine biosynthesis
MQQYIEPRLRRDFGGIITAYFKFLKLNMAGIFRSFIAYNGIFIALFLVTSYMLVIGFTDMVAYQMSIISGASGQDSFTSAAMVGFGMMLFLVIFLIASMFNYGLSSSYMSIYENQKINNIDRKLVWRKTVKILAGLILFALAAILLYIGYFIVQLILAFIPIIGTIASLIIGFAFNAVLSMSIFSYVHNKDKNVFDAIGEGFSLIFVNIWRAIGVNFVLGLLIQFGLYAVAIAPAVVTGIVIYHSVEESGGITESILSQFMLVISLSLLCVLAMFSQVLSQTVNSFLYFNLHETKYNTYLQSRISRLGEPA